MAPASSPTFSQSQHVKPQHPYPNRGYQLFTQHPLGGFGLSPTLSCPGNVVVSSKKKKKVCVLFACVLESLLAQAQPTALSSLPTPSSFIPEALLRDVLSRPSLALQLLSRPGPLLRPQLACRGPSVVNKAFADGLESRTVWLLWRQTHEAWGSRGTKPAS